MPITLTKMNVNLIKIKIEEIKQIETIKNLPFRKSKLKRLKDEILQDLPFGLTEIDNYRLYKTDTLKPYLQIYTKESWEKSQKIYRSLLEH